MGKQVVKLIIIPVVVSVIGGVIVFVIQQGLQQEPADPVVDISSENGSLVLTNTADEVLGARVAYKEGGAYCFPDRVSDETSPAEPNLWPGDAETFAPRHCNSTAANGYAVWVWDSQGDLIYHTEG